jgi:hypothetical protein
MDENARFLPKSLERKGESRTLATPKLGGISTIQNEKNVISFCIVFDLH